MRDLQQRNHALDGLRALAIAMVLVTHFTSNFYAGTIFQKAISVGGRGVDLFFVLSGWLLGSQLFRERQATGTVNIRRFWYRRWLRTLPAYFAILAFTFVQFQLKSDRPAIDWWRYFIFLQNYLPTIQPLGVTWSLCVEEHFYVLIAPLIWFGGRSRWAIVLTLVGAVTLFGVHLAGIYQKRPGYLITETHIIWQQCALGVALAWLATHRPYWWERLVRFTIPLVVLSLILIVLAMVNRTYWNWWLPDWGTGGWAVIFGTWILLANSSAWWRDRTHVPALSFVASRAYSLYLMHIEAIVIAKKLALPPLGQLVVGVVLAFLAAEILYRVIERPFNRLRDRI